MKTKKCVYAIAALLVTLLTACSTTTDPAEAYKGESAEQIFQGGEGALRDGDYSEAIKRFEALDVQYPFGRNAELAQLHIIYAYYKNSDYVSAQAAAERFIHAHPTNQHVDYAYFIRGLSNYYQNVGVFERLFTIDFATRDLTQLKKAFADFSELTTRFPNSVYAPAAHQYMVYLRNLLADHQLEVAEYYYRHKAYVAAANRASVVVRHYQGSPAVPDALVLMAKSYRTLHLTHDADETIAVLRYNYPDSVYVKEATSDSVDDFKLTPKPTKILPPEMNKTPDPTPPEKYDQAAVQRMVQPNGHRGSNFLQSVADEWNSSGFSNWFSKPIPASQVKSAPAVAKQDASSPSVTADAPVAIAQQAPVDTSSSLHYRMNGER